MSEFELIFTVDELSDDAIDNIYDRYDALVAGHGDVTLLTVTAAGANAVAAAKTIVKDLETIDKVVISRCYEDLVSRRDIAERCNVSPQAVGQWIRGDRHGQTPFPEAYNLVTGGVWLWGEVNDWLRRIGHEYYRLAYPCREDYAEINRWIRDYRARAIAVTVDVVFERRSTGRRYGTVNEKDDHSHEVEGIVKKTFSRVLVREGELID